jgi:HPt (histidine-containing phosphotransfer) domain-containing protein
MNSDIPIIDISDALNRTMGDVDFLKMMLEELHRTAPDYATRIRDALLAKDMKTLGSDAHQFKGAAANLGAKAMAQAALQLEKMGKSGSSENADEALDNLEQAISAFSRYYAEIDWEVLSST